MKRDVWLWLLVAVGFVLRMLPTWVWGFGSRIRDEAQYDGLADKILAGEGLGSPLNWLWAPGYPYLLAFWQWLLPEVSAKVSMPWFQSVLGAAAIVLIYGIARALFDRRTARWAAALYALNPTLAFFAGRFWCEGVYGPVLLGACAGVLWARKGHWSRALLPGVLLGLCVLLRGVATYLPPFFALALLWPSAQPWADALRQRWKWAVAAVLATVLVVAPYSVHASTKHGGLIISDATLGALMYLGNNDFEPVTYDYGTGLMSAESMQHSTAVGRPGCPPSDPVTWNRCEVEGGLTWIREHPGTFFARMPVRVAQLLNPHSFVTRAVRWGKFTGMSWAGREALVLYTWLSTVFVLVLGTLGITARGRGPFAVLTWSVVLYTVATSAALYGMTRYRVPLEPLWMVYAASLLARPRQTLDLLVGRRRVFALVLLALVVGHMLWFLPSGYPGFNW